MDTLTSFARRLTSEVSLLSVVQAIFGWAYQAYRLTTDSALIAKRGLHLDVTRASYIRIKGGKAVRGKVYALDHYVYVLFYKIIGKYLVINTTWTSEDSVNYFGKPRGWDCRFSAANPPTVVCTRVATNVVVTQCVSPQRSKRSGGSRSRIASCLETHSRTTATQVLAAVTSQLSSVTAQDNLQTHALTSAMAARKAVSLLLIRTLKRKCWSSEQFGVWTSAISTTNLARTWRVTRIAMARSHLWSGRLANQPSSLTQDLFAVA